MLKIDHDICTLCDECIAVCPFDSLERVDDKIIVLESCRLCRLCVRHCLVQAMYIETSSSLDEEVSTARNVLVVAELDDGQIHPVTLELVGKGREIADQISAQLACVLVGVDCTKQGEMLLEYGVDRVYVYDHELLRYFRVEPYTSVVVDAIEDFNPSIALCAATPTGRSLAPRVAARCRTGLTADCTTLEVRGDGELVQIRPAFGGNIMAQIITPKHRPQMATMRYKVMEPAKPRRNEGARLVQRQITPKLLESKIEILQVERRPVETSISDAEVIVAVGRGIGNRGYMELAIELAQLLGGQVGVTRPLVEMGWADYRQQIGLSGRAVRPKLLITVGISGAVQFTASITGAELVVAINRDPKASIFQVSHYGLVGDLQEIMPALIRELRGKTENAV